MAWFFPTCSRSHIVYFCHILLIRRHTRVSPYSKVRKLALVLDVRNIVNVHEAHRRREGIERMDCDHLWRLAVSQECFLFFHSTNTSFTFHGPLHPWLPYQEAELWPPSFVGLFFPFGASLLESDILFNLLIYTSAPPKRGLDSVFSSVPRKVSDRR